MFGTYRSVQYTKNEINDDYYYCTMYTQAHFNDIDRIRTTKWYIIFPFV